LNIINQNNSSLP